jgi:hypothetical protein
LDNDGREVVEKFLVEKFLMASAGSLDWFCAVENERLGENGYKCGFWAVRTIFIKNSIYFI